MSMQPHQLTRPELRTQKANEQNHSFSSGLVEFFDLIDFSNQSRQLFKSVSREPCVNLHGFPMKLGTPAVAKAPLAERAGSPVITYTYW